MAIVQTVDLHTFREAFRAYGRLDQFSWEGLEVLFDYLEQYSEDVGEPFELDVIAICCDFYEGTAEDICNDYRIDTEGMEDDEIIDAAREYLEDEGVLVGETVSGFVYRAH